MEQRHGQLSGQTLRFPFPLPGWDVNVMARTKAATLGHEMESTYYGWQCNRVRKLGPSALTGHQGKMNFHFMKALLFFCLPKTANLIKLCARYNATRVTCIISFNPYATL